MRMRECVDLATERCVLRLYSSICMRIEIFKGEESDLMLH